MAELKTQKNDASVEAYLNTIEPKQKQEDSKKLVKVFEEITKEKATMWGTSIIGFGEYHYKSDRSSQEGNWPMTGFAPRKQNISLYIMSGFKDHQDLLENLGKYKVSKGSCLYIKKLADVDLEILKKIIKNDFAVMKKRYPKT